MMRNLKQRVVFWYSDKNDKTHEINNKSKNDFIPKNILLVYQLQFLNRLHY